MSALDDNPTVLLVRKHLVEFLGPPDEVFELTGSPIPGSPVEALNLAYFAPQGPQSPVVFATCGAALFRMPDGRRVEGLVLLRREPEREAFDAVHRLLAQFSLFSESSGQPVQLGDMVRAPDMLRPFCDMDAVLFMPPVPFVPSFHQAPLSGDEHVDMVWLLPVYEAEADYAMKNGPQALMMLFAAQGLDLTDPKRGEANTLVDPSDAQDMAKQALEHAQANAQEAAPVPTAGKPKTSRRNMNQGSFNVKEDGTQLRITRRGGAKAPGPSANPGPSAPPRAPATPSEPMTAPPPRRGPPPGRRPGGRPVAVRAPSKKEEVRFDLGAKAPARAQPGTPKQTGRTGTRAGTAPPAGPPAPPKPRKPAPPPMTEAQKAEAKKKRVEALKVAAKEAAQRAEARRRGEAPTGTAAGAAKAAQGDRSAVRAAAKRRGGAAGAIESALSNDDEER